VKENWGEPMLSTIKNKRSLTFYQQITTPSLSKVSSAYTGGIASVAITNTVDTAAQITSGLNTQIAGLQNQIGQYNSQLSGFLSELNSLRADDALRLDLTTPNFAARSTGVWRAWQYEKNDIEMDGDGSAKWNELERQEILGRGRIRQKQMLDGKLDGPEGHHQQNVADHPEQQANPDNIKFYKSRSEHLEKGHAGKNGEPASWQNESNEPMIDKNQMLKDTNQKRVDIKKGEITQSEKQIFRNELRGLGIAIAIGLGVGVTIGFAITLAQSGITPETIKLAAIEGSKGGIEAGALAAVGYGIGRTIGHIASKAVAGVLGNLGVNITENILRMINMGVVGSLTIAIFSAYQFFKLKLEGMATRDALMQVGKQVLFSLSLLAVSIAAQGIYGGFAGIIVSVSIGIIFISYSVATSVHQRHFAEKIRVYMIDKCRPTFEN